jgi:hypothetical protein
VFEDKKVNGPEKCHNCGSSNINDPFNVNRGTLYFGAFRVVRHQTFVCADCYHSMFFIRKKHEEMFDKELQRQQRRYQ